MTQPELDLVRLSVRLEETTGYDSIPIITRLYSTTPRGRFKCCFPDCKHTSPDPADMWIHIHFSAKHGLSFGVSRPEEIT